MQATQSIPTAKPKSHAESFTALRRQASQHEKAGRWEQAAACWMQASEVAGSANPADVASKLVWGEYQRDAAGQAKAARERAQAAERDHQPAASQMTTPAVAEPMPALAAAQKAQGESIKTLPITKEDAVRIIVEQYDLPCSETDAERYERAARRIADFLDDVKKPTEARLHRWIKQNTRWEKKGTVHVPRERRVTQMTLILRNRRRS